MDRPLYKEYIQEISWYNCCFKSDVSWWSYCRRWHCMLKRACLSCLWYGNRVRHSNPVKFAAPIDNAIRMLHQKRRPKGIQIVTLAVVRAISKRQQEGERGKDSHMEPLVAKVITSSFELTNMVRIRYDSGRWSSTTRQRSTMGTRVDGLENVQVDGWMIAPYYRCCNMSLYEIEIEPAKIQFNLHQHVCDRVPVIAVVFLLLLIKLALSTYCNGEHGDWFHVHL